MLEILKMAERYIALLNSKEEIREDLFKLVIDSLLKILKSTNRPFQVSSILRQTHQKFLATHLTRLISTLLDKEDQNFEELILKLVTIIEVMLQRMPGEVVDIVPIIHLRDVVKQFHEKGLVSDQVKRRMKEAKALWEKVKKETGNKALSEKPPDNFRDLSVVPDYKDFQPGAKPFVRANVIDKAYISVEHYLDVQFRLLREDFIIPLRDGVKQLRRERSMLEHGPTEQDATKKDRQALVYHKVKILSPICNRKGGVYRIRFDPRHPTIKRIRWEKSKRLKFGALVCLSPDFFSTLYFGAVENRNTTNLTHGEIEIHFERYNPEDMRNFIAEQTSFQMVESDSYLEAYRHNLSALKYLNEKNLPFKEYIVYCSKDIEPPKYLIPGPEEDKVELNEKNQLIVEVEVPSPADNKEANNDDIYPTQKKVKHMNMTSIADPEYLLHHKLNMSSIPVLDRDQWPSKEALGLDESQYRACQLALTKRFALIQGPPGTGKTYVGLKIAHALLENKKLWNKGNPSPILMVSYTNHALDQFLMGLKDREGIVRVGGRSKEEELKENNLKMLRSTYGQRSIERNRVWRKIKEIEEDFCSKEAALLISESNKAILSVEMLKAFMDENHMYSLIEHGRNHEALNDTLTRWLGIKVKDRSERNENSFPHNTNFRHMFSLRQFDDDDAEDDEDDGRQKPSLFACHLNDAVNPAELRGNLDNCEEMSVLHERRTSDIFKISRRKERWNLYRLWRSRLQEDCRRKIRSTQDANYESELKKLHEIDSDKDLRILKGARVVGMTTTNAAKYHDLLQRVRPKIVIVEEAAEVLEAHILTSLPLDCEHVILIGDHQQLRPSCTVYELAKKYNLNISMFERLVKLQIPCVRLSEQHRMRPEIASLMKHIYEDLKNHSSVESYEDIQGFDNNVFFIDHRCPEGDSDDSFSHFNEHESRFLVKLCRYIIQQGYKPSQITILTPYLGQMFMIRDHMTEEGGEIKEIRLTTIDNYQGEENDIILLSLVRSNDTGHVGFVNDINRACVALSRARMGLYVIGNFELLSEKSDIWKNVVNDLKEKNQIGDALPLVCESHKDKVLVKEPKDFLEMVPDGGCKLPCEARLECGHACTKLCHPNDQKHRNFKCIERCVKIIPGCTEGHLCKKKCWEPCELKCEEPVDKILPCNHVKKNARCSDNLYDVKCDERCPNFLECGHRCQARCGEPCTSSCKELVKRNWPCGHEVTIACSASPLHCRGPCDVLCCGHECSGSCGECLQGRVHRRCKKICGRVLVCGHHCRATCTTNYACPPCSRDCENRCKHSKCDKKCGELCVPCQYGCKWKCKHLKCEKKCGEVCERQRCDKPCYKIIQECGHKCRGLCEETCVCIKCHKDDIQEIFGTEGFEDKSVRFLRLRDCKHIFEVGGIDQWVDTKNSDSEEKTAVQMKACPICKKAIRTTLRYNSVIKKHMKDVEKVKEVILADQQTVVPRREELLKKIRRYINDVATKSGDVRHKQKCEFLEKCITKCETSFELTNLENQVQLLERCEKVLEKSKMMLDTTDTIVTDILSILNFLKKERIIGSDVDRELRDIDLEISRQSLRLKLCSLLKEAEALNINFDPEEKEHVDRIGIQLSQSSKIEELDLEEDLKKIREIRFKYPMDPPTREEKDQIIRAMGLSKGHWYKCRQGHVYAIGDCGGAMETGSCPECHDVIGGASHRLAEGNEVATEMDGARHSAWSEQANMENYDLQE
ncbi:NFX1-type zinc finger-containing protein 1-like [Actinia tenebrosa]|uniref:NFX1-type zinc finger-containing protein 1-like n=1 Tax=Actinia tenebrosa TaxID=6105 RepID=A0A6P8HIQ1_ACTTE|nr:NFX1-type zinc finger-containing protein 1-like [Actinia tenebrosa]